MDSLIKTIRPNKPTDAKVEIRPANSIFRRSWRPPSAPTSRARRAPRRSTPCRRRFNYSARIPRARACSTPTAPRRRGLRRALSGLPSMPGRGARPHLWRDQRGTTTVVLIRDIEFTSQCEHHMMPFYGKAQYRLYRVERVGDCRDSRGSPISLPAGCRPGTSHRARSRLRSTRY